MIFTTPFTPHQDTTTTHPTTNIHTLTPSPIFFANTTYLQDPVQPTTTVHPQTSQSKPFEDDDRIVVIDPDTSAEFPLNTTQNNITITNATEVATKIVDRRAISGGFANVFSAYGRQPNIMRPRPNRDTCFKVCAGICSRECQPKPKQNEKSKCASDCKSKCVGKCHRFK
uniref:Uncharacterized protein n=1 Tax=Ditylenchus dipsaci TaxID=166011 RepID=A0A915CL66_9BILA